MSRLFTWSTCKSSRTQFARYAKQIFDFLLLRAFPGKIFFPFLCFALLAHRGRWEIFLQISFLLAHLWDQRALVASNRRKSVNKGALLWWLIVYFLRQFLLWSSRRNVSHNARSINLWKRFSLESQFRLGRRGVRRVCQRKFLPILIQAEQQRYVAYAPVIKRKLSFGKSCGGKFCGHFEMTFMSASNNTMRANLSIVSWSHSVCCSHFGTAQNVLARAAIKWNRNSSR